MRNGCLFGFLLILLLIIGVDECINKIKENTPEGKKAKIELERLKAINEQKELQASKAYDEQIKRQELVKLEEDKKITAKQNKADNIETELESLGRALSQTGIHLTSPTYNSNRLIYEHFIETEGNLIFEYGNETKFSFNIKDIKSIEYIDADGKGNIEFRCDDGTCISWDEYSMGTNIIYISKIKIDGSKSLQKLFKSKFFKINQLLIEQ